MTEKKCFAAMAPALQLAQPDKNAEAIAAAMARAHESGARLLVLPALSLTGASCGELFFQKALTEAALRALEALIPASAGFPGLLTALGLPLWRGERLWSVCAFLREGELLGFAPIAGDARLFARPESADAGEAELFGKKIPFDAGLVLPWAGGRVSCRPGAADTLAILSDAWADADSDRRLAARAAALSAEQGCAVLLAAPGPGESSTDAVYTGFCAAAAGGALLAQSEAEGHLLLASPGDAGTVPVPVSEPEASDPAPFLPAGEEARRCDRILLLQAMGLARRLRVTGAKCAVIGVSGGLDSTLALLAAAEAMDRMGRPRTELLAVTMPCFGTTGRTRSNAERMSLALGCSFRCVDIGESVMAHFRDIGHDPAVLSAVYENAQARERTQVLMDLANGTGGLVVGTGDMSELALGWCTYGGDQMSMYGVNAGIPKTVVRAAVLRFAERCADSELAAVLRDVVDTPVSPELLPAQDGAIAQKTEELIGPYALHDYFLYHLLREGTPPAQLARDAKRAFRGEYPEAEVERTLELFLRRFFAMQFKRSCMPDGPAVLGLSLSPRTGWRVPSDASGRIWLESLRG